MSLFGALFTGVSALNAQSQSLGMISNNIANVNTTGYKRTAAAFSGLVTGSGSSTGFSPGGVRATVGSTTNQQGLLQQSSSATDIAISGNGFFVVRQQPVDGAETLYTRSGGFNEDSLGLLRNASGYYLYGWRLDANGNLPAANADLNSLEPVDVGFAGGVAAPTTQLDVGINLDANDTPVAAPNFNFTRAVTVYDSLGQSHELTLNFRRAAAPVNTWTMQTTAADAPAWAPAPTTLTFNGAGGLAAINGVAVDPNAPATSQLPLGPIDWDNTRFGADNNTINLEMSNISQFSSDYSVDFVEQDGAELGLRTGLSIDDQGFVSANFSNGQTRPLYKLPVATFANPNGLRALSGEVFQQSTDSGDYNLREAGSSGAGVMSSGSLEASNVDIAEEFSRMIITQRAYSAGTKVVSTSDQMLTELLQIR